MERTSIMIPDAVRMNLKLLAAERNVSIARVMTEALEDRVEREGTTPSSTAVADSAPSGYLATPERRTETSQKTMERATMRISESLKDRLAAMARRRRVSLASVIREALQDKADQYLPTPRTIGIVALDDGFTARDSNEWMPEPAPWRSS